MRADLVERVRRRLAVDGAEVSAATVADAVRAEVGGVAGHADVLEAVRQLRQELVGLGPLEELIGDPGIADVLVTGPEQVWVDGSTGLRRTRIRFSDEASVRRLAQRLALAAGRRLDDAQPYVDGWLPGVGPHGRIRLHAVLPPIAAAGTCISLRVLRPATHDLRALVDMHAFDEQTALVLESIVAARLAFLITGGTGAGKSTLLGALLGVVPAPERIVCVEDAGELQPSHPQFVRLIARPPNVEGAGEITLRDLVRQALRMRPDRLVVGEVRGSEVVEPTANRTLILNHMTGAPHNPAIYCRLSYAPDGSVEKVERQEADVRQLLDRLGWPQPNAEHVFSDNSRSAWQRNRKRPEWDRMLAAIKAGRIDGVGTYHGDRLIRQPWDLELLLKLADDKRLPLASVSGMRDLNSEDDRFILRIEVAQACRESANTSRRVRRGWKARAERGDAVGGGKRPFGYGVPTGRTGRTGKPVYDTTQPVPEEAAVLAEAVERLLAGQSQTGVVRWMNTVSKTSQGYPWTSKSLRNLLLSPRIAGLIAHDGQLYEAVWPAIITVEQWEDLKLLMVRRAKEHPYPGRERKYLLTGIATCSGCRSTMRTKPSGGRNRKTSRLYHCPNRECTQRVSRNVEHLDAYVEGRVLRRLNESGFLDAVHADGAEPGAGAEIAALERRKSEAKATLENLADHPEVSAELAARSLASFDRKIVELRGQQTTTTRRRLLARMAGMTREQWDAEPIDVRAETVRALFEVVVLPATWRGPGFDPESVEMRRRSI